MADLPTLDDLLDLPEQEDVLDQEVLPEVRTRGAKVTSWVVGGVYFACAYILSRLYVLIRRVLTAVAAGGFEDYAFGLVAAPNDVDVTGWAKLVAKQRYGVDFIEATFTKRSITLTNATATPYGPISEGGIVIQMSSGNRYILEGDEDGDPITIPASDSVEAIFRAEFATNSAEGLVYNTDVSGDTIVLVTANFPGVTATNPETDYSDVEQSGSGVGVVTPSGTPSGDHSVAIRIDSTGLAATCAWSTSLDGGEWTAQSGATATDLGGFGINITLTDNSGNPSFAAGAYYYFSTPGTDIVQLGRDEETPQELGARCRAMWPLLAVEQDGAGNWIPGSPTMSAYELLARLASDQVKVAYVETGDVNNEVNVVVAGQGALLPASAIVAVQGYLDQFSFLTDSPVVSSPALRTITIAGLTITVKRGQLVTAQAAVQRAIGLYLGGVDPENVLSVNGLIDHGYLVEIIRGAAGVKRITNTTMTINAAIANLQLPVTVGAREMASWSQVASTAFTWAEE